MVDDKLSELLKLAKNVQMSDADRERQRRSFAYGNAKVENENITMEAIDAAAKAVAPDD